MTSELDLERKIRRVENDVTSIYEMLTSIGARQMRQGNRLAELAATQDEHTASLAEHGTKLDRIIELLERC